MVDSGPRQRFHHGQPLTPNDLVTAGEIAISNMWEIASLLEVLERKGICTKQEVLDMIQELRRKTPQAEDISQAFPEPYLNTQADNAVIDRIFELFNATGLSAHQAKNLVDRVSRLVELGEGIARKTNH